MLGYSAPVPSSAVVIKPLPGGLSAYTQLLLMPPIIPGRRNGLQGRRWSLRTSQTALNRKCFLGISRT